MLSDRQRLRLAQGLLADLEGGFMEAVNGTQSARVPLQEIAATVNGVTVVATFGELDANFEWSDRRILTADGELVDSDPGDHGRKVMGAVWTVQAQIELTTG